jgi:hypothetical protein
MSDSNLGSKTSRSLLENLVHLMLRIYLNYADLSHANFSHANL